MKHSVQRNGFVIPEGKILRCAQDDRGGAYNVSPEDVEADMYYVYMISNWNNRVLYTGMTNNLERRVYEHKNHLVKGFTSRYNVHKLVYFDSTEDVKRAIEREKQIKGWTRAKKDALVEQANPGWHDLSADWNMSDASCKTGSRHNVILTSGARKDIPRAKRLTKRAGIMTADAKRFFAALRMTRRGVAALHRISLDAEGFERGRELMS